MISVAPPLAPNRFAGLRWRRALRRFLHSLERPPSHVREKRNENDD